MKTRLAAGLLAVLLLVVTGCAGVPAGPATLPAPSPTTAPTDTPAPSATPTEEPATATPTAVAIATPTGTSQPPEISQVEIFLVALEDAGQSGQEIGCGDSLVPVEVQIEPTAAPLTAAMKELLSIHDRFYGQSGLYDALYQSDLQVESVAIQDSTATIRLTGQLQLGGVCDNPRVEAQLTQTALQFSTVDKADIFINDKPLDEVLSLK